eukprot:528479_1
MAALNQIDAVLESVYAKTDESKDEKTEMTCDYIIQYLTIKSKTTNELVTVLGSPDKQPWKAKECGDGNINYIFVVEGCNGSVVVKQAPPFIRLVGPDWALKQQRLGFEVTYTQKVLQCSPQHAPKIYLVDNDAYLFAMEDLNTSHMVVFRGCIAKGIGIDEYPSIGQHIGIMTGNMLFKTSDLCLGVEDKWNALKSFCDNNEMVCITEQVIFEEPFCTAKNNRYQENDEYKTLCPQMVETVQKMRSDSTVIRTVFDLRRKFRNLHQALVHGDLHTGSVMCNKDRSVAIDAEFSYYGPMFVDVGLFMGNMLLAAFSQQLYDKNGDRAAYVDYLCKQTVVFYNTFYERFVELWNTDKEAKENGANLIPTSMGSDEIRKEYQKEYMEQIWNDSIKFAGVIMIRRCLGIADGPEFRIDKDRNKDRWNAEEKAVRFGMDILNGTVQMDKIESVVTALRQYL